MLIVSGLFTWQACIDTRDTHNNMWGCGDMFCVLFYSREKKVDCSEEVVSPLNGGVVFQQTVVERIGQIRRDAV